MKEKYDVPGKMKLDHEQAFRRGYDDAQRGSVIDRDHSPFKEPTVRKHWKRGFDMGRKGLVLNLPKL